MKKKLGIFALTVVLSLGLSFQAFAAEYTICIGKDFKDGDKYEASLNTVPAATKASRYFINAGYDSYVCPQPTIGLLKSNNDDRTPVMSSSILYFNGEGTVNSVSWWEGKKENPIGKCGVITSDTVSGSSYCNITKENFRYVKLAMFMACNTAPMAQFAKSRGAKSALGFHYEVRATDMEKFSNRVIQNLAQGLTLSESIGYADGYTDYDNDKTVTKHAVEGGSTTIASYSRNVKDTGGTVKAKKEDENGNIVTEEIYVEPYVEKETPPEFNSLKNRVSIPCTEDNMSIEEISEYIKENIDPDFDINHYEIDPFFDGGDLNSISFYFKVGDFKANAKYMVFSENGYVTNISKAGIIDYTIDVAEGKSSMSEEEMKADAIEKDNLTNRYDVKNQEVEKRIDMKTGRCYYIVLTTYENKETGGGRLESQEYDINAKIIEKAPAETDTQNLEEQPQEEKADDKEVTENETNDEKVIDKETDNKEIADENKTDTEQKDNPVNENETNDKKVIDKETDDKKTDDKTKTDTEQKDNQISENETTDEKVNENETDKETNKEETNDKVIDNEIENKENSDKDIENEIIEKKTPVEVL